MDQNKRTSEVGSLKLRPVWRSDFKYRVENCKGAGRGYLACQVRDHAGFRGEVVLRIYDQEACEVTGSGFRLVHPIDLGGQVSSAEAVIDIDHGHSGRAAVQHAQQGG